ncbi:hypothetical protein Fcan01_07748 [Folsomia candida]|uniref:DUF7789 domain-containing protein n=1 Tax=Folsomia candida TaxID=158441 RepID=A0A226EIM5_FOLCA|nr:hypothetical protein Fcan01_07748 [Folsomia candida]
MMERRYSFGADNSYHYEEHRPILIENYRRSFLGRVRTLSNIQRLEWYFILFSFAIISIGFFFTVARMVSLNFRSDQFLVCILVVINLTFSTYYLVHGILQEQPFEILAYIFTTLIIAVFVTINFVSVDVDDYVLRVMRFMITIILSLPNIVLAVKIGRGYWQSGTFIFKTVGGDRRLQRICRIYLFGQSLLIFDMQAMLSCAIIVIQDGFSGMTNEQTYMFITGIIFAFIWLFVGYAAMRTENTPVTWVFAVISIVQPLYVIYLIVQFMELSPAALLTFGATL